MTQKAIPGLVCKGHSYLLYVMLNAILHGVQHNRYVERQYNDCYVAQHVTYLTEVNLRVLLVDFHHVYNENK